MRFFKKKIIVKPLLQYINIWLVVSTFVYSATGIINTETILSQSELKAKEKIEEKEKEVIKRIDEYESEIIKTNEILGKQIVELEKIKALKVKILLESQKILLKVKNIRIKEK